MRGRTWPPLPAPGDWVLLGQLAFVVVEKVFDRLLEMLDAGVRLEKSVKPFGAHQAPSDLARGFPDSIHQLIDQVSITTMEMLRFSEQLVDDFHRQLHGFQRNRFSLRPPDNVMDACDRRACALLFRSMVATT